MSKLETEDYKLVPIEKNRYKIVVNSFLFKNEHAAKIDGCYFSGPQQSWVMPQNKKCLEQFTALFPKEKISSKQKAIQDMIDHLTVKRYSQNTITVYKDQIIKFFDHFPSTEPSQLTDEDVKEYILFLIKKKRISLSYQKQAISAIKFYFEKILRRDTKKYYFEMPRNVEEKLPIVLSKTEVKKFFSKIHDHKKLAIFKTIYSCGLRLSELINLKISDIDSERMLINVRNGKGMKDRLTILSVDLLEILRMYFTRHQPKTWLFEASPNQKYTSRAIQKMFHEAFDKTGIRKKATVHTLRHSFATHLLENGEDIRKIQLLLGHRNLKTTEIYTHVTKAAIQNIASPLDNLLEDEE